MQVIRNIDIPTRALLPSCHLDLGCGCVPHQHRPKLYADFTPPTHIPQRRNGRSLAKTSGCKCFRISETCTGKLLRFSHIITGATRASLTGSKINAAWLRSARTTRLLLNPSPPIAANGRRQMILVHILLSLLRLAILRYHRGPLIHHCLLLLTGKLGHLASHRQMPPCRQERLHTIALCRRSVRDGRDRNPISWRRFRTCITALLFRLLKNAVH